MDDIALKVSDIIVAYGSSYRVICIQKDFCVLCQMGSTSLDLKCMQTQDILAGLVDGNVRIENSDELHVADIDSMDVKTKEKFIKRRDFIRDVAQAYGPTFLNLSGRDPKDELNVLIKKHSMNRGSAWRYIKAYLQSGLDEYALLPKKTGPQTTTPYQYQNKPGRKYSDTNTGILVDQNVQACFAEALDYYKSGRANSIRNAFDLMNLLHFTKTEVDVGGSLVRRLMSASERPTLRQFQYYITKTLSKEEKDRIKTSAQEQRNNKRLLLSDNLKNIMGPGDCIEIDEVEVDISLVSQIDPEQVVGRPIVYAMIDVYTRAIIAVSVSFDNNSIIGLTNCLMNLAEDKVALCQKYGIHISPEIWPSMFLPRTIRADRGSEYRSKEAKRIFNELNINLELVPGGSGSLKGSIEQWFHQLHSAQNPLLEGRGLIQKRHDSKHHQEARLTIEDFKKIVYNFVVTHNQTYMDRYPLTHDMIAQKTPPIPLRLWEYGITAFGNLKPIANKEQFIFSLLRPVTAKLSRKGITYKGLYYMDVVSLSLRQRMYEQGNKAAPVEMRIDPRDVGALYMLNSDGNLMKVPLNTERAGNNYSGVSLAEYLDLYQAKKSQDKLGKVHNEELRVGLLAANSKTIAEAEANTPRYASTKNIRGSRAVEKKIEATKHSVSRQLLDEEQTVQAEIAPPVEQPESPTKYVIPKDVDEAFELFELFEETIY